MTLALLIEYDGTNYGGWQRQPNALTIQECLEKAALGVFGFKVNIVGAGRTDAGVHARGQVAHGRLTAPLKISEEKIVKALNAHLPNDIRVNGAKLLRQEFHARFDATAREYSYSIISKQSVFLTHFASFLKYPFNSDDLQKTGSIFLGKKDYTTFSKLNEETKSYVCDVYECKWDKVSPIEWRLKIKSDRFVYGMVRSIVGAMIDIARGKRGLDEISSALKACDRSLASPLAPAQGLILEKIYYPDTLKIF